MVAAVVGVNLYIDALLDKAARIKVATAAPPPEGGNYLLIGSDTRAFVETDEDAGAFGTAERVGGQRSDTMMVVHVEPDARRTLAVSFPRDLLVDIPGLGRDRINSAFNAEGGGADRVIETLRTNFGIEINHYVEVDFKSFRSVVEAIGKVHFSFPAPTRDSFSGLVVEAPGCVALDGPQALAYVRSRTLEFRDSSGRWYDADPTADIGRIKRQQDFIRQLLGRAVEKGLSNPVTGDRVLNRVVENLTLDQGVARDELVELVAAFRTLNPKDTSALEFATFPYHHGPLYGGASVLYPDSDTEEGQALIARLNDFTSGRPAPSTVAPADVKLRVLNGSGVEGAAKGTLREFGKLDFTKGGIGNDRRGTVRVSEIRYRPNALEQAKLVLDYVDPAAKLVPDATLRGADVAFVIGTDFRRIVTPAGTPADVGDEPAAGTPTTTAPPSGNGTSRPYADAIRAC